MSVITERKKEIIQLLSLVEQYPSTGTFKHEMMTYVYVLVCGGIEFMVETILQEWQNKSIQYHGNSSSYRGKKYIKYFLNIKSQAGLEDIKGFHSTSLDKIRYLIGNIAGDQSKDKFNLLLQQANQSVVLQPDINARLKRINRFRHELAHGGKMPKDTQPNITELKEDFIFVYKHIVKNILKSLPRI